MFRSGDVFWPLRILFFITPFQWTFSSYTYLMLEDISEYQDAELCEVLDCPQGFRCAETVSPLQCYGKTGQQILNSLHVNYETVRTTDSFAQNAACVLLITAVFKAAYVRKLYALTRGVTPTSTMLAADASRDRSPMSK